MSVIAVKNFNNEQAARGLRPARIAGTGAALPSVHLSNADLAKFLDTTDEWITERVGIRARNICGPDETCVSLATIAATRALESANLKPDQIDLVIYATVTPDQQLPAAASLLARNLGIYSALAFDIQAACSGFLFSLATADALLHSMKVKRALVIGAESLSRIVDWTDRNTAVLFGDGAGACIVERPENCDAPLIISSHLRTESSGADFIRRTGAPFPPATAPASDPKNAGSTFVEMQGREVFKAGVQLMTSSIKKVLSDSGYSIDDVALFVPHQSNIRMIKSVCQNIGLTDTSKIGSNIDRIGNTSAASIPMVLDEVSRSGRVKKDDLVLLTAVGGGMTYGSILMRW